MQQKVIVIHGGSEFSTYGDYLDYLKHYPLERILEKETKRWKDHLAEDLGEEYDVISPEMPSPRNARYEEWKIWFEKFFSLIAQEEEVILVGHSLGGAFLLKYCSEDDLPCTLKGIHLVAAVVDNDDLDSGGEKLKTFVVDRERVRASGLTKENIHLYHSKDDVVVPYSHAQRIAEVLPEAVLHTFQDRNHFFDEHFPEIITQIKEG